MAINGTVGVLDILVFAGLETLGTLAILGNLSLIVVLLRNKYLNRASFMLMLSLASADVMHGVVTTCFFYPPIILKYTHVPEMGIRLFNIVDWTAWAITLTHMSAICLDRLVAIMLYGKYNQLVTISRISRYCIFCWVFFFSTNSFFFFFNFCCLTQPLEDHNYYTFGYELQLAPRLNVYTLAYTPVEVLTICILTVSNPITLVQLYRRHKRKVALRMASTMLLEMSMKMGSRQINHDVRDMATRRANRQQQRILVQISVVALIFYAYMTAYYISYYVSFLQTTATMIFNSFFYSTTHMINPVIYFSLNKEMRDQLWDAVKTYYRLFTCRPILIAAPSRSNTHREHTLERTLASCATYSETVPFLSSTTNYKVTGNTRVEVAAASQLLDVTEEVLAESTLEDDDEEEGEHSRELRSNEEENWNEKSLPNKMASMDRSQFMNDLIDALKCESDEGSSYPHSRDSRNVLDDVRRGSCERKPSLMKTSTSLEVPSRAVNGRFIRVSNTLQVISKTPRNDEDSINIFPSTSTFDGSAIYANGTESNADDEDDEDETLMDGRRRFSHHSRKRLSASSSDRVSSSSTPPSSLSTSSWKKVGPLSDSVSLLPHEYFDSCDDEGEVSYL